MCGRYSLTVADPAQLRARFPIGERVTPRPRFNVAPTDEVLAVTVDREGSPHGELLRWGLIPGWAKDAGIGARLINARIETAHEKPAFRQALERRRCLIPADGFYEWERRPDGRHAFHITRTDGQLFAFAGLWAVWHPPEGDPVRSCTILTTAANGVIAPLHDRMPVILDPADEQAWLDPATPEPLLRTLARGLPEEDTAMRPVGPAVNRIACDGPECLQGPAHEQSSLFAT